MIRALVVLLLAGGTAFADPTSEPMPPERPAPVTPSPAPAAAPTSVTPAPATTAATKVHHKAHKKVAKKARKAKHKKARHHKAKGASATPDAAAASPVTTPDAK